MELGTLYYKITGDYSGLEKNLAETVSMMRVFAAKLKSFEQETTQNVKDEADEQTRARKTALDAESMEFKRRAAEQKAAIAAENQELKRRAAEQRAAIIAENQELKRQSEARKAAAAEQKAAIAAENQEIKRQSETRRVAAAEQKEIDRQERKARTEAADARREADRQERKARKEAADAERQERQIRKEAAAVEKRERQELEAARRAAAIAEHQRQAKLRAEYVKTHKVLSTLKRVISVAAVTKFYKTIITAASDAEESNEKLLAVFTRMQSKALDAAADIAKNYGVSKEQAEDMVGNTGNILTGFGLTQEAALQLSVQISKLGVDLASFVNYAQGGAAAANALTRALLGRREAAKQLGVAITENDIKQLAKLYNLPTTGLTRQQRALLTMQIMLRQTTNAQGDFARTQGYFKNQSRQLQAAWEDLARALGDTLLPTMTKTVGFLTGVVRTVESLPRSLQLIVTLLPAVALGVGVLTAEVRKLVAAWKVGEKTSGILAIIGLATTAISSLAIAIQKNIRETSDVSVVVDKATASIKNYNAALAAHKSLLESMPDESMATDVKDSIQNMRAAAESAEKLAFAESEQRDALIAYFNAYETGKKQSKELEAGKSTALNYWFENKDRSDLNWTQETSWGTMMETSGDLWRLNTSKIAVDELQKSIDSLGKTTKSTMKSLVDAIAPYVTFSEDHMFKFESGFESLKAFFDELSEKKPDIYNDFTKTMAEWHINQQNMLKAQGDPVYHTKDWKQAFAEVTKKIEEMGDAEKEEAGLFNELSNQKLSDLEKERDFYEGSIREQEDVVLKRAGATAEELAKMDEAARASMIESHKIEFVELEELAAARVDMNKYYDEEITYWTEYYNDKKKDSYKDFCDYVNSLTAGLGKSRMDQLNEELDSLSRGFEEQVAKTSFAQFDSYEGDVAELKAALASAVEKTAKGLDLTDMEKTAKGLFGEDVWNTMVGQYTTAYKAVIDEYQTDVLQAYRDLNDQISSLSDDSREKEKAALDTMEAREIADADEKYKNMEKVYDKETETYVTLESFKEGIHEKFRIEREKVDAKYDKQEEDAEKRALEKLAELQLEAQSNAVVSGQDALKLFNAQSQARMDILEKEFGASEHWKALEAAALKVEGQMRLKLVESNGKKEKDALARLDEEILRMSKDDMDAELALAKAAYETALDSLKSQFGEDSPEYSNAKAKQDKLYEMQTREIRAKYAKQTNDILAKLNDDYIRMRDGDLAADKALVDKQLQAYLADLKSRLSDAKTYHDAEVKATELAERRKAELQRKYDKQRSDTIQSLNEELLQLNKDDMASELELVRMKYDSKLEMLKDELGEETAEYAKAAEIVGKLQKAETDSVYAAHVQRAQDLLDRVAQISKDLDKDILSLGPDSREKETAVLEAERSRELAALDAALGGESEESLKAWYETRLSQIADEGGSTERLKEAKSEYDARNNALIESEKAREKINEVYDARVAEVNDKYNKQEEDAKQRSLDKLTELQLEYQSRTAIGRKAELDLYDKQSELRMGKLEAEFGAADNWKAIRKAAEDVEKEGRSAIERKYGDESKRLMSDINNELLRMDEKSLKSELSLVKTTNSAKLKEFEKFGKESQEYKDAETRLSELTERQQADIRARYARQREDLEQDLNKELKSLDADTLQNRLDIFDIESAVRKKRFEEDYGNLENFKELSGTLDKILSAERDKIEDDASKSLAHTRDDMRKELLSLDTDNMESELRVFDMETAAKKEQLEEEYSTTKDYESLMTEFTELSERRRQDIVDKYTERFNESMRRRADVLFETSQDSERSYIERGGEKSAEFKRNWEDRYFKEHGRRHRYDDDAALRELDWRQALHDENKRHEADMEQYSTLAADRKALDSWRAGELGKIADKGGDTERLKEVEDTYKTYNDALERSQREAEELTELHGQRMNDINREYADKDKDAWIDGFSDWTSKALDMVRDTVSQIGDILSELGDRTVQALEDQLKGMEDAYSKTQEEMSGNEERLTKSQKDEYKRRLAQQEAGIEDMRDQVKKAKEENFKTAKAFNIAEATINIPLAALRAYTANAENTPLAITAAALAAAFGAAQLAMIATEPMPSYAVGAYNLPQDQVATVHKGEMIVPKPFADEVRGRGGFDGLGGGIVVNIYGAAEDGSAELASADSDGLARLDVFTSSKVKQMVYNGELDGVLLNRYQLRRNARRG